MKKRIAELLVDLNCLQLRPKNPFVYASGLTGPIYCDNRLIISHVLERKELVTSMLELIKNSDLTIDVIAGIATAGIPWSAWLADALDLPMIYVRAAAKKHGKNNRIEGEFTKGSKILLVEDLINQGGSSVAAGEAVISEGGQVIGLVAIMDYQLATARNRLEKLNCPVLSLTDLETLTEVCREQNILDEEEIELVNRWRVE